MRRPAMRLNNADFPTFGLPTIAINPDTAWTWSRVSCRESKSSQIKPEASQLLRRTLVCGVTWRRLFTIMPAHSVLRTHTQSPVDGLRTIPLLDLQLPIEVNMAASREPNRSIGTSTGWSLVTSIWT